MHVSLDPARAGLDPMANLGLRPGLGPGLGLGPRAFSHADLHNFSSAHAELNPYASQNDIAGLAAQVSIGALDVRRFHSASCFAVSDWKPSLGCMYFREPPLSRDIHLHDCHRRRMVHRGQVIISQHICADCRGRRG